MERYIYTAQETKAALLHIRDVYHTIRDLAIADYDYMLEPSDENSLTLLPLPLYVEVLRRPWNGTNGSSKAVREEYEMRAVDLGPFANLNTSLALAEYVQSLESILVWIHLRDTDMGLRHRVCFEWRVQILMTVVDHSYIK